MLPSCSLVAAVGEMLGARAVADHRADLVPAVGQRGREAAADEPGCSCDECLHEGTA